MGISRPCGRVTDSPESLDTESSAHYPELLAILIAAHDRFRISVIVACQPAAGTQSCFQSHLCCIRQSRTRGSTEPRSVGMPGGTWHCIGRIVSYAKMVTRADIRSSFSGEVDPLFHHCRSICPFYPRLDRILPNTPSRLSFTRLVRHSECSVRRISSP